jgi:O-antigen/teichoic acid export membrane protein
MSESKKFAYDVGITFLASVANFFISFIITIFLGKFVGADDLGLYRMIFTLFTLILLVSLFGIPSALIKYIAENKNNQMRLNELISSGIISSLLIGLTLSTVIFLSSNTIESFFDLSNLSELVWILTPVFPFALINEALLGVLNGLREMKKFTLAFILKSILTVIITPILILNGFGAIGAVLGLTLSTIGSCLFLLIIAKKYYSFTLTNSVSTTKELLNFGIRIVLAQVINETTNQLDIFLIGFYLFATDIGYYAAAISLSRFLWLIPSSIQRISYPTTAEYWRKKDYVKLSKMLDRSMKYATICLVLLGLSISFGTKEIIFLIFNEDFIPSIIPLQILLTGAVIRGSMSQPIGGSLTGIGRPDLVLKNTIIVIATNFSLGVLLIPSYGIIGAAISTSISLIVEDEYSCFICIILTASQLSFDKQSFDYWRNNHYSCLHFDI